MVKIEIIKASKNFRITAAIEDIGYLNPPSKNCLYTSSKMVTLLKLVLYVYTIIEAFKTLTGIRFGTSKC